MTVVDVGVPLLTFFAQATVGMDLTPAHFGRLRRQPGVTIAGLAAPVILLPILAVALIWVFRPADHVAAGLLLVAACPIGGISNTYSYLARASPALSVMLTALSCALCFLTIPLISWGLERMLGRALGFSAPGVASAQLALMVVLPVFVGMSLRDRWPAFAGRHQPALQRVAFVGLVVLLVLVVAQDVPSFTGGLRGTVPLAATFVVASFAAGWGVGRMAATSSADRFTLAAEFATRNVAIATAMAVTLLGQASFAIFAAVYLVTEIPILLAAVGWYRSQSVAVAAPRPGR